MFSENLKILLPLGFNNYYLNRPNFYANDRYVVKQKAYQKYCRKGDRFARGNTYFVVILIVFSTFRYGFTNLKCSLANVSSMVMLLSLKQN